MSLWLPALLLLICLGLAALFAASETALTASSRSRLLRMEKQGNRRARAVLRLLESRERLLGTLLVSNALVTVAAVTLATGLLLDWSGDLGEFYAVVLMGALVIVVAQMLPRTLAALAPERIALRVARPVGLLVRLLGPVVAGVETVVRLILHPLGIRPDEGQAILSAHGEVPAPRKASGSMPKSGGTADATQREGSADKPDRDLDRDMVSTLLGLRELTVSDVMVHRTEMVSIDADDPPQEIVTAMLKAQFTRVPLWRGSPENIVGVLHAKDLLRAIQRGGGDLTKVDIAGLMQPLWFVPDIRPLSEQLKAFRRRRSHFALVVDEYGEVEGLVTLEDILEEIVGDISDERDVPVPGVQPQPDGSVTVEGTVPTRDLNRAMDWNLPDEEATTIAGLVIHEARSIPDVGQSFTFHGFRFRVVRRERNRIAALRITPLKPELARA